jgi:hypothetical protein
LPTRRACSILNKYIICCLWAQAALVTLGEADVRALGDRDLLAVRSLAEAAV